MNESKQNNENRIRKLFALRPENFNHLVELAKANNGNKSATIQRLIEDAWNAKAKETK